MNPTTDPLEYWKNRRMQVEVDEGFAKRVLDRVGRLQPVGGRRPMTACGWGWRILAGAAAVLLGLMVLCIRIGLGLVAGMTHRGY
jgi:hypothetical protein